MEEDDIVTGAAKLVMAGELDKGEEMLKGVVKSVPRGWRPMKETAGQIAYAFWDMPDFQAFVQYQSAAGNRKSIAWVHPSYSRAYYYLGYINVERKENEAALTMLDKSLELEPDSPRAMSEKAQVLVNIGRKDEALELFSKAFECRPWAPAPLRARALRGVGFCCIEKGELDRAEELFLRSLEFEPGSRSALNELGYIGQLRQSRDREAKRVFGGDVRSVDKQDAEAPDIMILERICPVEALMDDNVIDEIVKDAEARTANKKTRKVFVRFTSDFMKITKERRATIAKRIRATGADIMIAEES